MNRTIHLSGIFFRAVLFMALTAMPLSAQAQSEHVAHYQAYHAALDNGDLTTAIDEAEKAWRAAEQNLGDHQTTAVLAYNVANLVYFTHPQKAVEPLNRVIAMTGENNDMFGVESPRLMLLLVNAVLDDDSREKEQALRTALENLELQNPPPNLLAARAWLHLAGRQMIRKRYERAEKFADFSTRHYTPFIAPGEIEVANAFIIAGISRIAGRYRNTQDLRDALVLLDQAIEIFPAQTGIDTFDPKLAIALAWRSTTVSAAVSDTPSASRNGTRIKPKTPDLGADAVIKWDPALPDSSACDINWQQRPPPKYPDIAERKGYFGAVLIGYNIVGTKVDGARILAEVPATSVFGEITLESMDGWVLAEEQPPECRSNHLVEFRFAFSP